MEKNKTKRNIINFKSDFQYMSNLIPNINKFSIFHQKLQLIFLYAK